MYRANTVRSASQLRFSLRAAPGLQFRNNRMFEAGWELKYATMGRRRLVRERRCKSVWRTTINKLLRTCHRKKTAKVRFASNWYQVAVATNPSFKVQNRNEAN